MKKNNKALKTALISLTIFTAASIILLLPVFKDFNFWGEMDWDQFVFFNAASRVTLVEYHQFPLWNPYTNGGNVMLAHPHSSFLSPLYLCVLLFGPVSGLKLEILIHLIIGMWGMFFLSKYMKLSKVSSYLASFVYMLSSTYFLHIIEGHAEWLPMAFIPWLFACYLKSFKKVRYVFGGIFFLSLILLAGSIDVFNIVVIFFSGYALLKVFQIKKLVPIKMLALIFIGTFLLCAVKLIPMLEFIKNNPRKTESNDATEVSMLPDILLSRDQADIYQATKWTGGDVLVTYKGREFQYGWHEYGAYVGLIPLVLAIIGVFFYFRQYWPLFTTGILSLWITLGKGAFPDVWGLIHKLPVYDSLHVPSRFILGFLFCISIFAGLGLSKLEGVFNKKYFKFFILGIIGFVFLDLFSVNYPILRNTFTIKPVNIKSHSEFKQRYREFNLFPGKSRSSMYPVLLSNSGIINSYEVITVKRGDVKTVKDFDYKGETYFLNGNNEIKSVFFTPNKIKIKAYVKETDKLIVNQNFYTGWKVKGFNGRVCSYNGLISVELPPGGYNITLYYLPKSFILGLTVTVITFLSCIMIFWRLKQNKRKNVF